MFNKALCNSLNLLHPLLAQSDPISNLIEKALIVGNSIPTEIGENETKQLAFWVEKQEEKPIIKQGIVRGFPFYVLAVCLYYFTS